LFSFWTAPVLEDAGVILPELDRTIRALKAAGVPQVIVVGPSAEWVGRQHALPRNLIRIYEHKPYRRAPARTRSGVNAIAAQRDAALSAGLAGRNDVHYFSAYGAICNQDGCMTRAGDDPYDLMTWDYGHLTASGAAYVARRLEQEIGGFDARLARPRRRGEARQHE
jgi:lysophospholipase L1-like esterase